MSDKTTVEKAPAPASEADHVLVVGLSSGALEIGLPRGRTFTLGRSPACEVVIEEASISRRHVVLTTQPLMITDCGSHNGTTYRGARLAEGVPQALSVGESFIMGNVAVLVRATRPEDTLAPPLSIADVVLDDPKTRAVYDQLDRIAPSHLALLIRGETGVGKDVLARELHRRSGRKGPFVEINCAALPESILEGELFGHERGAFTGATQARPGLFEAAHGGTLFLDEIGELPLTVQAKLLRVLETGEIRRLGARRSERVDVRFVSATHRDLEQMIERNQFRRDLFFRVCGVSVTLPALRERTDLLRIADAFLQRTGSKRALSSASHAVLLGHPWPGNVRELKNVIERAVVLALGPQIEPVDLGLQPAPAPAVGTIAPPPAAGSHAQLDDEIRSIERGAILAALKETNGNKTQAAKLLGLTRYALLYRLRTMGIGNDE